VVKYVMSKLTACASVMETELLLLHEHVRRGKMGAVRKLLMTQTCDLRCNPSFVGLTAFERFTLSLAHSASNHTFRDIAVYCMGTFVHRLSTIH
jgi:hypothetical protein